LSHTAIVARELGIPAIIGVQNARKVLSEGEIITLDGSTGLIQRKSRMSSEFNDE